VRLCEKVREKRERESVCVCVCWGQGQLPNDSLRVNYALLGVGGWQNTITDGLIDGLPYDGSLARVPRRSHMSLSRDILIEPGQEHLKGEADAKPIHLVIVMAQRVGIVRTGMSGHVLYCMVWAENSQAA
jgi:hypothetical protein